MRTDLRGRPVGPHPTGTVSTTRECTVVTVNVGGAQRAASQWVLGSPPSCSSRCTLHNQNSIYWLSLTGIVISHA